MDAYDEGRAIAAAAIAEWKSGTVTLTRTTRAAPDPSTPWIPGAPTATVYELDAVVKGAADYADTATIVATDLMVVVSPKARLAGATVDLVPVMSDTLQLDGADKVIKKIQPSPAAGAVAVFRIFVAS